MRFSRDRRGYEHIYLVHTPIKRGKPGRTRVLYWYRSPPGVKVGREAFDPGVRRELEAQYPDLTFDWETLAAPPPPPPTEEPWRERRRLQKARKTRTPSTESEPYADADLAVAESVEQPEPLATDLELLPESPASTVFESPAVAAQGEAIGAVDEPDAMLETEGELQASAPPSSSGTTVAGRRGRRRRRARRGPVRPPSPSE